MHEGNSDHRFLIAAGDLRPGLPEGPTRSELGMGRLRFRSVRKLSSILRRRAFRPSSMPSTGRFLPGSGMKLDPGSPWRGAVAGLRSDHATARGVRHLGIGPHHLSCPRRSRGSHISAPVRRPTNGIPRPWRVLKKVLYTRGRKSARSSRPAVEAWFQEEMRVGQKNRLPLGSEGLTSPRRARSARAGAALGLPACNSEAVRLHLNEITTKVAPGAHAIVILDQAGWHGAKDR
jgi:hypothetical protein